MSIPSAKEICRIGGDEFIIIANKDSAFSDYDMIESVSCGYIIKEKYDCVSNAVAKTDNAWKNDYSNKLKKDQNS